MSFEIVTLPGDGSGPEIMEPAVEEAVFDGLRTSDLGGKATTREATDAVLAKLP